MTCDNRPLRLAALLACLVVSAATICHAGSYRVEQPMSSGQVRWVSGFSIDVGTNAVRVDIDISLLLPGEINRSALEQQMAGWSQAIDRAWNNRFVALVGGTRLPIRFVVEFTHFDPHHRVIVHPDGWIPNQHNWYLDTPAAVIAHEIGHMLGAYDEYNGGALSPGEPLIDRSSIMGGDPSQGLAYPRHLHLLQSRLAELLGDEQIRIVAY